MDTQRLNWPHEVRDLSMTVILDLIWRLQSHYAAHPGSEALESHEIQHIFASRSAKKKLSRVNKEMVQTKQQTLFVDVLSIFFPQQGLPCHAGGDPVAPQRLSLGVRARTARWRLVVVPA